jgi:signal transduction histidine kinase
MTRLPIRFRLTAAFALATALVLAGAGVFVYVRLRADLDDALRDALRVRARAFVAGRSAGTGDSNEGFAQLLASGRVVRAAGPVRRQPLTRAELRRAARGAVLVDRRVPEVEGQARILAEPTPGRSRASVVLVGQSLQDRDEALASVVASFAIGIPLAVLAASLLGFGLATAGFGPVETMRRRASRISLLDDGERLPLPAAHDEIRRLGVTLNTMLDRLRAAFERERRFVADASHELRTPVAVVKAELEAALRVGDHGPETREALHAAVEECEHLVQLAEDLLVLARAGDGRLPVRCEPLHARALLGDVRERALVRAAARGRTITLDAPERLDVDADPLRVRQALGNLVDNALRHGEGAITLRAREAPGGVELDVGDEGLGFPVELGDRAFERFNRGARARNERGAGLGRAIVRASAEAHGGHAAIVPGAGTTVRVWLPANLGVAQRAISAAGDAVG